MIFSAREQENDEFSLRIKHSLKQTDFLDLIDSFLLSCYGYSKALTSEEKINLESLTCARSKTQQTVPSSLGKN